MANRVKLLVLLGVVIPLALSACATKNISGGYKLKADGDNGLIVGSVALVSPDAAWLDWRLGDAEFRFRGSTKHGYEESGALSIKAVDFDQAWNSIKSDNWNQALNSVNRFKWSEGGEIEGFQGIGTARLFAVELPAGNYEFFDWRLKYHSSLGSGQLFSLPFKVEAGKVHYLGQLTIHVAVGTDEWGIDRISAVVFRVYDERERDLAMLAKRYPALADSTVLFELQPDPSGSRRPRFKRDPSPPVL